MITELTTSMVELVGGIVVPIAHELGYPHQDPVPTESSGGGGASTIVILAGVVFTLLAVGGLVWLKQRTAPEDPESSA